MSHTVLDQIPFDPDVEALVKQLRLRPGSKRIDHLHQMVDAARAIARPKAVYRVARVEARGDDHILLGGTRLTSRVLRVNLAQVHRAFVYVATCGVELEEWVQSQEDTLDQFQADAIAGMALTGARQALAQHLEEVFDPGHLGEMNPGSLDDWPLREQRQIFELLGDPQAAIGVQLLDSYLMKPTKTTSGVLFPTEDVFHNCQLCPMEDCPGRKAPYDPDLYDRKYRASTLAAGE